MVRILGAENSLFNQYIYEIRESSIQKDSMRFRRNMERIGEIFAYEISKHLEYKTTEVTTPLGITQMHTLKDMPVLATILRAGLPLHQGFLNYFDRSESAFISAYREYRNNEEFEIQVEYVSHTNFENKILILIDPMLATGQSMVACYRTLLAAVKPKHTHIVSAIASMQGVDCVKKMLSQDNISLWIGAIDDELTAHGYIVPGLGDAGDLSYGIKI